MYTILQKKLNGLKEELGEFTRELVATESVTYDEGAVAAKIRDRLIGLGYDKVFEDEFGNVVGILYGREASPTVLLTSHMDTVATDPSQRWDHSPLSARVEDGKIYGLGAADCKGGIAAQAYSVALLKRSLLPRRGNLVFAATSAEGNGIGVGIRGFLEKTLPGLGLEADYAIMGEPTDLGLYYGHDGWVQIEMKIEGPNAFLVEDAARSIAKDFDQNRDGDTASEPAGRPEFQDILGHRNATIRMNRNLREGEDVAEVIRQVGHEAMLAAKAPEIAIDVDVRKQTQKLYNGKYELVRHVSKGWGIDPYDSLVVRARQSLLAAGREAKPGRWKLSRFGMGTAGNVLVTEFGIPTIGFGPGREELAHTGNEYVEVKSLAEAAFGTAAIVHGLIGIPVYGWTSDEI
jgi:acetylornithine deacetylase/succinyl-diaminopimelate desuccinylase-like protein